MFLASGEIFNPVGPVNPGLTNGYIDPLTGKFTSPNFYSTGPTMPRGEAYGPRISRYARNHMRGLGAGDQKQKIADVIDSISKAVRGEPKDPLDQFRSMPWQNYILYGLAAFGAFKVIQVAVKRR